MSEFTIKKIEKWETSGYLDGLNFEEKEKIACILESSAASIVLNHQFDENKWAFPIIRRVIKNLFETYGHERFVTVPLPAFLHENVPYVVLDQNLPLFKILDLSPCPSFDCECEIIRTYCDSVQREIKRTFDQKDCKIGIYTLIINANQSYIRYAFLDGS